MQNTIVEKEELGLFWRFFKYYLSLLVGAMLVGPLFAVRELSLAQARYEQVMATAGMSLTMSVGALVFLWMYYRDRQNSRGELITALFSASLVSLVYLAGQL